MPSWNIHTAHVERLLADCGGEALGIADENAFLFGNYVPDIYLGFMVPDTTYRIDYCLTHLAEPNIIPVPNADQFWDECICHPIRCPKTPSGWSLTLGTWAHLAADRVYNARFRAFCRTHDVPRGDELRLRKQADFALFGHSIDASWRVNVTPELLSAAQAFRPYSVLPADVDRAVAVADSIAAEPRMEPRDDDYQLLGASWMRETFEACNQLLSTWLKTWQKLKASDAAYTAADIHALAPELANLAKGH